MLDIPVGEFYSQEGKQKHIKWLGITIREFLQKFGTDAIRNGIDRDFWVKKTAEDIDSVEDNLIFTDMRFPNEMDMIRSIGGFTVNVGRNATISDWNKTSGIMLRDKCFDDEVVTIPKEEYIKMVAADISNHVGEEKEAFIKAWEAMNHTSEVSLDFEQHDYNYLLETGEKPRHGHRFAGWIFNNGFVPWEG
jgi:hypothetical protein